MNPTDSFISARQFAIESGYTERSIRRWIDTGQLPAVRSGEGRVLIPRTAAEAFLAERRTLTPV